MTPDVIVAPLIAFDRAMNRLGQGGGYYDRAFARFPDALRIGLAWSAQELDDVPADPWDLPLDTASSTPGRQCAAASRAPTCARVLSSPGWANWSTQRFAATAS